MSRRVPPVAAAVVPLFLTLSCFGQDSIKSPPRPAQNSSNAINVNWLYGAYVPREVELKELTPRQRLQLYFRQTYTTWGIYAKTAAFSATDQASGSPPEWGDGFTAYAKRFGSRYGQFAIQNSISTAGNYLLKYEPRYDRCRCSGFWPRISHALVRNFVTYNSTEHDKRPQIGLYVGAMGAGMIEATWRPGPTDPWRAGYQSVLTQVAFGSFANIVGEFAPEIKRKLIRK